MKTISATELQAWIINNKTEPPILLDVREDWEFEICHIEGSQHISMNEVPERMSELNLKKKLYAFAITEYVVDKWLTF